MANQHTFPDVFTRFWSVVTKTPTCWLWMASTRKGYGGFRLKGKTLQAHRFAYEYFRGPIPPGLTVDHVCRIRACVNPDHLELVTNRVNLMRGISPSAMNARKTHCRRGHEFTPQSTYRDPRGKRSCRICWTMRNASQKLILTPPPAEEGEGNE